MSSLSWIDKEEILRFIYNTIEQAMEKGDRSVTVTFFKDSPVVSVYPITEDGDE